MKENKIEKIGAIVELDEPIEMTDVTYEVGDKFEIVGSEDNRGWNIKHCVTGRIVYETAMCKYHAV